MAKFSRRSKLTPAEQEKLLIEFCKALVEIKTPQEAAHFMKDLFSRQEAEMLAKRIAIARLLIQGKNYTAIRDILKVSFGTISRVSQWLATSGEGYRIVVSRVKEEKDTSEELDKELMQPFSWKQIKRKYPAYFWPELVMEEIVKSASKRQKEKLRNILSQFDQKQELFNKLNLLLKNTYKLKGNKTFF